MGFPIFPFKLLLLKVSLLNTSIRCSSFVFPKTLNFFFYVVDACGEADNKFEMDELKFEMNGPEFEMEGEGVLQFSLLCLL